MLTIRQEHAGKFALAVSLQIILLDFVLRNALKILIFLDGIMYAISHAHCKLLCFLRKIQQGPAKLFVQMRAMLIIIPVDVFKTVQTFSLVIQMELLQDVSKNV
jgi:hypothetical protein